MSQKYLTENAEKLKNWRLRDREKLSERSKSYYERNKDRIRDIHSEKYDQPAWRAACLLNGARRRKPEGFTLTLDHVVTGILRGHCAVTGVPFNLIDRRETGISRHPHAPSLDKIDAKKPYTNENTRIVIWQYNMMKGEISDDEVLALARIIVARAA